MPLDITSSPHVVLQTTIIFVATNTSHVGEEKKMSWIHHHDLNGIPDYPDEFPFDTRIFDYWINESGVRIGFFAHAKGAATFTYKKNDLNFKFYAARAPNQSSEFSEKGDRTLGPICSVYLISSRQRVIDGKTVTDPRESLFDDQPIGEIKSEITDFLLIYQDPRFPSPVAIESVIFPLEKR